MNLSKHVFVSVFVCILLGNGTNVWSQETSDDQFVPRQEYEQLKRDFEHMKARMEAYDRRMAEPAPAATPAPAASDSEVQELRVRLDAMEQRSSWLRLEMNPEPRWVRREGWMEPDFRTQQMDLLIGSVQNIDVYLGLQTAGRLQALTQKDVFIGGVEQDDLDPGFQTAWGDLAVLADIENGKMEVFFDLYISSRPHPATMYGNEGYILFRELPDAMPMSEWLNTTLFRWVNVKAGHFEIDFGDHRYRRSDNAWVQNNPLIGNYIIDPDVEEIGMEIYSKPQFLNWLVGISSGTTTENLNEGRGIASVHGKLWSNVAEDLRLSVSGYYVDHSDNPDAGPGSTKGSLFSGQRSGGPYGAVIGGGNAPGQVLPGRDQRVTAFQGDITWMPDPWEVYGHVGWMRDEDPNGSLPGALEESWTYGAAELVYRFTPRLYGAGRYSFALANDQAGMSSDGQVHRVQLGGGLWITKNVLAKAEYVYQFYSDFDPAGGPVSGVDVWEDPYFHGLIFEVSFAF